jgi:hypothetical protein
LRADCENAKTRKRENAKTDATRDTRHAKRDTRHAKLASGAFGKRVGKRAEGTRELGEAAAAEMLPRLADFNLKDLANAAWGLAIMERADPVCLQAIGRQAAVALGEEGSQFSAQECRWEGRGGRAGGRVGGCG